MNIRMARRCLNGGCQEAIQCPEGRCALHAAMSAPVPRNEGPEELVAPKVSEKDINRWQAAIQERPEGPWTMGCGGSFDRTTINPISDEMLAELAQWLHMGYTPWNGRSMPLSPGDRQFMFMLYYSVQGLIARMRAAEKTAAADGWHSVAVDGLPPCDGETVYLGQNDAGYLCTFTRVNPDGCCVQGTAEAVTAQFSCLTWWRVADRPGRAPTDSQAGRDAVEADCHGLDTAERVRFYEHDFYPLSNFSAFRVTGWGRDFDTSEHAYHWHKFPNRPDIQDNIQCSPSAHEAFKYAESMKPFRRPDWDDVKVGFMRAILHAKAAQHEYVRRKLLATGDRELVEDSWRDDFWGWGPNRDGQNMLGNLWMEVRAELRAALSTTTGRAAE